MGTAGIDTTVEADAILDRLKTLPEEAFEGVPQGYDLSPDAWSQKPGYRDVTFGSVLSGPSQGRAIGVAEGDQPHVWTFEVAHTAPTKREARLLATATDAILTDWAPSANATEIKPFYIVQYSNRNGAGTIITYTAVRFYETTIGVTAP